MSNETDGNSDFERRAKRAFDDSVAALDVATRSKLTQARYRALDEQASARDRGWRSSLVPAGTVAATALVAFLVMWQQPQQPNVEVQQAPLGDLEILLGEEDLEMLDEELEFYGWLEAQPEFANADSVG
jgi:negative regulator of sigma E activity